MLSYLYNFYVTGFYLIMSDSHLTAKNHLLSQIWLHHFVLILDSIISIDSFFSLLQSGSLNLVYI